MKGLALTALTGMLAVGMLVASPDTALAQHKAAPDGAYKKVSTLVPLPDFVPGLGTLYVDPATLPAGPGLPPRHHRPLVSPISIIPLQALAAPKPFSRLHDAHKPAATVD